MTIVNDAGDSPEIIMDVRRRPILIEARDVNRLVRLREIRIDLHPPESDAQRTRTRIGRLPIDGDGEAVAWAAVAERVEHSRRDDGDQRQQHDAGHA